MCVEYMVPAEQEKLRCGLPAWYECASIADSGGQSANGWRSLSGAPGIGRGFGKVFIGNWDTPFKRAAAPGDDSGIFGAGYLLSADCTSRGVGKRRRQNPFT